MPRHEADSEAVSEHDMEEDSDDDEFVTKDYDASLWERAEMVCEIAELASRNLKFPFQHDSPDDTCEGRLVFRAVNKTINDLRFLVPTSSSHKWDPNFVEILSRSHSMRVTEVSETEREELRNSTGKCVICGTFERSTNMIVELCGDLDNDTFDAREWVDVEDWPALFDKLLPAYDAVKSPDWCPPTNRTPKEYLGAWAIGSTCLRHLINAFVAQTLMMELTFGAWTHVCGMGDEDPGYKNRPTVTAGRIGGLLNTLAELKACAASDYPRLPSLPTDPSYWARIDAAIARVTGGDEGKTMPLCGARARELLNRAATVDLATSDEEDDDGNRGRAANVRRNARPRGGDRRGGSDEDEEEDEEDDDAPPSRRRASARKSTTSATGRPTRAAATAADAARRRMCCGFKTPTSTAGTTRSGRKCNSPAASVPPKKRPRRAVVSDDEEEEAGATDTEQAEATRRGAAAASGAGGSRDPLPLPLPPALPPRPAAATSSVAPADQGAGRLRAMGSDPTDPDSRMLRGYDTTVSEAMELSRFLHAQGHPLQSAAASRIVVVLQELIEKNCNLRAAAQQ
jgi:hypothetical protein